MAKKSSKKIPAGLCQCGCGGKTLRLDKNIFGYRKGQFRKFISGHNNRIKPKRLCSFPGCNKPHACKGYCNKHYTRLRIHGSPSIKLIGDTQCSVNDCTNKHYGKGLCAKHYQRLWKTGTTESLRKPTTIWKPIGDIPFGKCQCGCGGDAPLAPSTKPSLGYIRGQPMRYISRHHLHILRECSVDGCSIAAGRYGLCWMHSLELRQKRRNKILRKLKCGVSGCAGHFGGSYHNGIPLCVGHYLRIKNRGRLDEHIPIRRAKKRKDGDIVIYSGRTLVKDSSVKNGYKSIGRYAAEIIEKRKMSPTERVRVGFNGALLILDTKPNGTFVECKGCGKEFIKNSHCARKTKVHFCNQCAKNGKQHAWLARNRKSAKLSDKTAKDMRNAKALGYTNKSIAAMFGLSHSFTWQVLTGKAWNPIKDDV